MSNRLTFSLASLILILVAGFALLIPSIVEADTATISAPADQVWTKGSLISTITATPASHGNDTAFTYTLTPALPTGVTFNANTRVISGTPTVGMKTTTYTYTVVPSSGNDHKNSDTFTIKVESAPAFNEADYKAKLLDDTEANSATNPIILTHKIGSGDQIIQLPLATDEDDDSITHSISEDISGLGFQFNAGLPSINVAPFLRGEAASNATASENVITYTASDGTSARDATLHFRFDIVENLEPTLQAVKDVTATVNQEITPVRLPLVPVDKIDAGATITYTLTPSTLPSGLVFTEAASLISGTPTEITDSAGIEYTWTATDEDGDKAEVKFKITVKPVPVPVTFGGTTIGPKTFTVGEYTETLLPRAQHGIDDVTYALTPTVPAGLTFDASTRILNGTPTAAAAAVEYTYTATDSATPTANTATLTFNITVNAKDGTTPTDPTDTTPPTVTITGAPTAAITAATEVTLTFDEALKADPTVTGDPAGTVAMYTTTVAAATAANTYTVTITPTAAADLTADVAETAVTFTVAAMDTNDNSLAADNTFDVTLAARTAPVTSANNPPTFNATSIADLVFWENEKDVRSSYLPLGEDKDLNDSLKYSVEGTLPAGLTAITIDGNQRVIAGTPTAAQAKTTYQWVVTDSAGDSAKLPFTITVIERLVPGAVMNLTAEQDSCDSEAESVDLMWDALAVKMKDDDKTTNDGGSAVTHYMIMWTGPSSSGTIDTSGETDPDAISYTFEGDLALGEYTFKVAAVNAVGTGAYSTVATVDIANPPSAPRNLRAAIDQVSNTVTLNWLAPASDGNDPISGHVVYITDPNATTTRTETGSTSTTYRTKALSVEGQYVFRVAAENSCDEGDQSHAQPLAVVILANKPPVFAAGSAIDDITVTAGTALVSRNALPIATDPEGETVQYRINPTLPRGVSFDKTTRVLSGTPASAMETTLYTYTAWDGTPGNTGVMSASLQFSITVNAEGPPPTAPIDSTISLPSATIPPNGFVVLQRNEDDSGIYAQVNDVEVGLANLDHLFRDRGGIALIGPGAAKDLVFSEIMWGSDSSLADDTHSQWIELYNTTKTSLQLSNYTLKFYSAHVGATAGAIDEVNSLGWGSLHGQRGRTSGVDTQGVHAQPVEIISMYRKINFTQVARPISTVDPKHSRKNQLEGVPGGSSDGSWAASTRPSLNIAATWRLATPGTQPRFTIHGATSVPRGVIISEIGNSGTDAYDWFELYNTTDAEINLKKWQLSRVTDNGGKGKEDAVLKFPDNDNIKIPAKSYLVIAASNPKDTGNDLAAGIDITKSAVDQAPRGLGERGNSAVANYAVLGFSLPNDTKKSLFILRNGHGNLGKAAGIQDVIGTLSIKLHGPVVSSWTGYDASNEVYYDTSLWPLHATGGPHGNVIDGGDEDFRPGKVYQRNGTDKSGLGEKHLSVRGYTGVGYDRHAAVNGENGGTPGYAHDAVKGDKSNWMNQITISEIMLPIEETDDAGRIPRATRLPQWFEIYNASMTEAVSLNNWYLEIQNTGEELNGFEYNGNLHATLRLPNVIVQPNQTVLVVSSSGLNSGNFPEQRTINVFLNGTYRSELGISRRGEPILNPAGFYMQLRDHKNNHVDEVGNLGLSHRTGRTGVGRRHTDTVAWDISLDDLVAADGHRTSIIRIYNDRTKAPADGLLQIATGTLPEAESGNVGWRLASSTNFRNVPSLTYYGNHLDYGTPGYRGGGPLPVSLSKFRPERLKATGEVVIRWATESELNNAGFNILRSETRDGQFTKVNTQLIKGHGTTSERNTYEWKDTTAKPNVVYYYQIQDVSLDGQVQTLRISRLKGNVTAAGKATTTWGELKALQ